MRIEIEGIEGVDLSFDQITDCSTPELVHDPVFRSSFFG